MEWDTFIPFHMKWDVLTDSISIWDAFYMEWGAFHMEWDVLTHSIWNVHLK